MVTAAEGLERIGLQRRFLGRGGTGIVQGSAATIPGWNEDAEGIRHVEEGCEQSERGVRRQGDLLETG